MAVVLPIVVCIFLTVLATASIIMRFISRWLSRADFWWDDWISLAALPFCWIANISLVVAAFHGLGEHNVDPTFVMHALYIVEVVYCTGITLTKIAVLCFYYRIFSITRQVRICIWAMGSAAVLWGIGLTITSILQCTPIDRFWNRELEGTCIPQSAFFMGQALPNIILDFGLLILPLVPLWRLNVKPYQKWALVIVFVLGYVTPLLSVLRLISFIRIGHDTGRDLTFITLGPALWSAAEVSVAIFSSSLPSLTHIFQNVIRPLFPCTRSTIKGSRGTKDNGNNNSMMPGTIGTFSKKKNNSQLGVRDFKRLGGDSIREYNPSETELSMLP